jgi:hypothetical protein
MKNKIILNESDLKFLIEKVLNEQIGDNEIQQVFKTAQQIAQKLNVGQNKAIATIKDNDYNGNKFVQVHYTQKIASHNIGFEDDKILSFVKRMTGYVNKEFMVLEKYYDKPIQFIKNTFSRKAKYVKVESLGGLTAVKVTSATERYLNPEREVCVYGSDGTIRKLMKEADYIKKYGSDNLNLFEVYVDINFNEVD